MTRFAIEFTPMVIAACLVVSAAACVDTTPLLDSTPDSGALEDSQVEHSASKVAEASVVMACRACIVNDDGACRPKYDDCTRDPKCKAFIDCVIDIGCLTIPTFQDRFECANPCLKVGGIAASTDPALLIAVALNLCTLDSCGTACGGGR